MVRAKAKAAALGPASGPQSAAGHLHSGPASAPAGRPAGGAGGPARAQPGRPPEELQRSPFPGRTMLYVHEVAERLKVTEQHVRDFIEEGLLRAVNVGSGCRNFWRIPVEAYVAFLEQRKSPD